MRRPRIVLPITVLVLAGALSPCGMVRPAEVDRVDEIAVTGGTCRVAWWLAGVTDGATDEAWGVARAALAQSTVDSEESHEWHRTLTELDDTKWPSATVLEEAVHREVVRSDVREALADAGFPDHERVIETYSSLHCSA